MTRRKHPTKTDPYGATTPGRKRTTLPAEGDRAPCEGPLRPCSGCKESHRRNQPSDAGVYRLWIRLDADVRVTVGRLGRYYLPEGMYVYIGSARRGLAARLARHQRRRKPLRWHVDYLLTRRAATIECIETRAWREGAECRWVRQTLRDGGRVVVPGFGAGDCRARCGAHLLAMPDVRGAG